LIASTGPRSFFTPLNSTSLMVSPHGLPVPARNKRPGACRVLRCPPPRFPFDRQG
jgi:hypothetical protein